MRSYWVLPSFSFAAAIKKKHNEEATIRSILAEIAERIPSKIQTIHLSSSETINRLRNDTISWSSQLKNSNQSNRVFRPVQVGEDWNWSQKKWNLIENWNSIWNYHRTKLDYWVLLGFLRARRIKRVNENEIKTQVLKINRNGQLKHQLGKSSEIH